MNGHLSVACHEAEKRAWKALAERLGHDDLSTCVRAVLNAACRKFGEDAERWESHMLHLDGSRIVSPTDGLSSIVAFQIVGPAHFWRHVDAHSGEISIEQIRASPG